MRRLGTLLLVFVSACSGGLGAPDAPDLRGAYEATWTFRVDDSAGQTISGPTICTGTLSVTTSGAATFSGRYEGDGNKCPRISGVMAGEVQPNGAVTFKDGLELFSGTNCATVGGDTVYSGAFGGGSLSGTQAVKLQCTTAIFGGSFVSRTYVKQFSARRV